MSLSAARSNVITQASRHNGFRRSLDRSSPRSAHPTLLSITRLLFLGVANLPLFRAAPIFSAPISPLAESDGKAPDNPTLWVYLGVAVALVLLGGAFAGLTIALMGQDEIYLQVIATSGEGSERRHAKRVLQLLKKGKHWVLVTLLLSNVITNETLPIVLDRSLGGGWPAVLSSTVLIVIFGEIAPQSVCVRYGLTIGAWMSPFVLVLMWIMAPVAWPTAKLLDKILGEDHGTTYKKAGLKTLVTLHKTLGTSPDERLNQDEVTIISAVLDLKDKPVGSIMTPMKDVFTLSADTVLDEKMMDMILSAGYSRIPIYAPDNDRNFVGMLLVKMLITYDPEDAMRVRDFALATLPETRPDTSCLDIVNFFQEGKSHMVLVSDFPGESYGALGVVTLEDVIEELIGEEIIDESDVFIDVHKAIRRLTPAPRTRVPKGEIFTDTDQGVALNGSHGLQQGQEPPSDKNRDSESRKPSFSELGKSPKTATLMMRRRSSNSATTDATPVAIRGNTPEMREHLRHIGPSNVASRPKQTRYTTVKIKPGVSTIPEGQVKGVDGAPTQEEHLSPRPRSSQGVQQFVGSAGLSASDAVQAVQQGYGTMNTHVPHSGEETKTPSGSDDESRTANKNTNRQSPRMKRHARTFPVAGSEKVAVEGRPRSQGSEQSSASNTSERNDASPSSRRKRGARSGSIMEHMMEAGGVKKLVLETNSSSENENDTLASSRAPSQRRDMTEDGDENSAGQEQRSRKSGQSNEEDNDAGTMGGGVGAFVRSLQLKAENSTKRKKSRGKKGAKDRKEDSEPADGERQPLLGREG